MFEAFAQVDRMPDPASLVRGMDETSRWEVVQELRAHTAAFLRVGPGSSVLDVGCGPGDVVIGFARATGPGARAVGIDASTVMVDEARRRAADAGVTAEFSVGDAMALDFPDGTFDACRSERTFQWLADPALALGEMIRVTRPGGAVAVIDSDWATFSFEHPDSAASRKIVEFFHGTRPGQTVGRRLRGLFRRAGLDEVTTVARAVLFEEWDPDTQGGPPGLPPISLFIGGLVQAGALTEQEGTTWLAQAAQVARDGDFCGSLTMYAVCGRKPAG
jgi:ubiquinone/menaquinone biosynthesis C-methylase UbiE